MTREQRLVAEKALYQNLKLRRRGYIHVLIVIGAGRGWAILWSTPILAIRCLRCSADMCVWKPNIGIALRDTVTVVAAFINYLELRLEHRSMSMLTAPFISIISTLRSTS